MFFLCDVIPYFSKRKFIDPHRDHKIFDAKPPFGGDRNIYRIQNTGILAAIFRK